MKNILILCLCLVLVTIMTDASPILTEKQAKQLLRTRRADRPRKAGFTDEPMREYLLYNQVLERRSEEQLQEHWLNPHCKPHCNSNIVTPV
ncbi:uncharacterized protein C17orf67 homolog [Protopterus annectens]|uniref:uncharacterized protein C17orf67 homolog n=1 Tax=Protopterus annectens TaxID=7888 RepID=UPI001CFAD2D9|nr:uncharacterized protein C17orf67 homolog [Protopterus annectens]